MLLKMLKIPQEYILDNRISDVYSTNSTNSTTVSFDFDNDVFHCTIVCLKTLKHLKDVHSKEKSSKIFLLLFNNKEDDIQFMPD